MSTNVTSSSSTEEQSHRGRLARYARPPPLATQLDTVRELPLLVSCTRHERFQLVGSPRRGALRPRGRLNRHRGCP
jgi:hypothetical protein